MLWAAWVVWHLVAWTQHMRPQQAFAGGPSSPELFGGFHTDIYACACCFFFYHVASIDFFLFLLNAILERHKHSASSLPKSKSRKCMKIVDSLGVWVKCWQRQCCQSHWERAASSSSSAFVRHMESNETVRCKRSGSEGVWGRHWHQNSIRQQPM